MELFCSLSLGNSEFFGERRGEKIYRSMVRKRNLAQPANGTFCSIRRANNRFERQISRQARARDTPDPTISHFPNKFSPPRRLCSLTSDCGPNGPVNHLRSRWKLTTRERKRRREPSLADVWRMPVPQEAGHLHLARKVWTTRLR